MICLLSTCWRTKRTHDYTRFFQPTEHNTTARHERCRQTETDWQAECNTKQRSRHQAAEPTRPRRRCEWDQQIVVVVGRASWLSVSQWGSGEEAVRDGVGMGLLLPVAVASRERIRQLWFLLLLATFYLAFCCCSPPNELHIFFLTFGLFVTFVCVCLCVCASMCVLACCPMGGGCRNSPRLNGAFNESWIESATSGKFTQHSSLGAWYLWIYEWILFLSHALGACVCVWVLQQCVWRVRVKHKLIVIGHGIGWRHSWQYKLHTW